MAIYVEHLKGWVAPADAFTSFYGTLENSFWLDREHHPTEPFSVIGTGAIATPESVSTILDAAIDASTSEDQSLPFTFRPGLVGVFEYEPARDFAMGSLTDSVERERLGHFLSVDRAMIFDHQRRHIYFIADLPEESDFKEWYHAALLRLALIGGNSKLWLHSNPSVSTGQLELHLSQSDYLYAIERAQAEIAAGNSYQLCLTNRIRSTYHGNPLSYFIRLRARHPAPYAGYLKINDLVLASISPERLLTVQSNRVWSSPIKGTRPRLGPGEDEKMITELASDTKERAENLMIVDLLRNDLQRVCKTASVSVSELLSVKTYSTLHQLVSEVTGELLEEVTPRDVLGACFPAGSMTGAPKIASMRILANLEGAERGVYSGGFGYVTNGGNLDLGMVIRTVLFQAGKIEIGVGGGLTVDSKPETEYQETLLKARALIEDWNQHPDW